MYNDERDVLQHFGVKGMHWGVRRGRSEDRAAKKAQRKAENAGYRRNQLDTLKHPITATKEQVKYVGKNPRLLVKRPKVEDYDNIHSNIQSKVADNKARAKGSFRNEIDTIKHPIIATKEQLKYVAKNPKTMIGMTTAKDFDNIHANIQNAVSKKKATKEVKKDLKRVDKKLVRDKQYQTELKGNQAKLIADVFNRKANTPAGKDKVMSNFYNNLAKSANSAIDRNGGVTSSSGQSMKVKVVKDSSVPDGYRLDRDFN